MTEVDNIGGTKGGISGAACARVKKVTQKARSELRIEARPRRHGGKLASKLGRFGLSVFRSGIIPSDAAGRQ